MNNNFDEYENDNTDNNDCVSDWPVEQSGAASRGAPLALSRLTRYHGSGHGDRRRGAGDDHENLYIMLMWRLCVTFLHHPILSTTDDG